MEPPQLPAEEPQQPQDLGPSEKEEDVRWALLVAGIVLVGTTLVEVLRDILQF
jgi:hypothetical protein